MAQRLGRFDAAQKAARHVGDDRDLAVAADVFDDARMSIDPRNPLAIALIVGIERERHAADVEREPRGDGLDQLVDAVAMQRRDAQRRRVLLLQPAALVRQQRVAFVVHLEQRNLGRADFVEHLTHRRDAAVAISCVTKLGSGRVSGIFGSQRIQRIMERLGMEEGEPIEHRLVTRAIATAQKRVENHNFEIRKHLLEYDDVMNKQREIIYGMRRQILDGESQADTIQEWTEDMVAGTLDAFAPESSHPEEWDFAALGETVTRQFDVRIPAARFEEVGGRAGLDELVLGAVKARYVERERELGTDLLRALERHEMLIVIDTQWKDHLLSIDHLKEGIGLRGYGQRDPLTEYKKEAFDLFQDMVERTKAAVVERLFKVQVLRDAPIEMPVMTAWANTREGRGEMPDDGRGIAAPAPAATAAAPRPTSRKPS